MRWSSRSTSGSFLIQTGGGAGFWGESYLRIDSPKDIDDTARLYGFEERFPDLVMFGSDGGGETFAIERSTGAT